MMKQSIAATALILALIGGACSSSDQGAEPVTALNEASSDEVLAGPAALDRVVEGPELETAFGILSSCLSDAGISGSVRFDLGRSAAFTQQLDIGTDPVAGERKLNTCFEPFNQLLQTYIVTHPDTDAQKEAIRTGVEGCASRLFPGQVPESGTLDDVLDAYVNLLLESTIAVEAQSCLDEVVAGPLRPIG